MSNIKKAKGGIDKNLEGAIGALVANVKKDQESSEPKMPWDQTKASLELGLKLEAIKAKITDDDEGSAFDEQGDD